VYRRLLIGKVREFLGMIECGALCRLKICDTAGYKPALRHPPLGNNTERVSVIIRAPIKVEK
jgi:hypothetical protein